MRQVWSLRGGARGGDHVAADRAGGVLDSELGSEFLGDPILAPLRVVARDALDEGDVFAGDAGAADRSAPDFLRQKSLKP